MTIEMTVEPDVHAMRIMDDTGDTKKTWDPSAPDEVEDARRTFDDLKKKGYTAYRINEDGEPGEVMRKFDSQAKAVIMRPAMKGG